jgi:CheY-like chemotaxis protein
MTKMLKRMIPEDVELVAVLDPALERVKLDPTQMEQVLMNLAVNARDAMPKGGKLTLETANAELDLAYSRSHPEVQPGKYVMLAVSDTGCGMDRETQARIFEPFFTTKEKDKGTGLGLSTVYGIVKQSGGSIFVYSEPGKGTAFKIYLPRAEEVLEPKRASAGPQELPKGTETVLVAEDDETLRRLIYEILQSSGYAVLEAGRGEEALRLAGEHAGPIHLLITDMVMPGMGGRDLAVRLAALRPETRVLYVSGYTDDAIVRHGVLESGLAFLQKPFVPEILLRKVREVLEALEEPGV